MENNRRVDSGSSYRLETGMARMRRSPVGAIAAMVAFSASGCATTTGSKKASEMSLAEFAAAHPECVREAETDSSLVRDLSGCEEEQARAMAEEANAGVNNWGSGKPPALSAAAVGPDKGKPDPKPLNWWQANMEMKSGETPTEYAERIEGLTRDFIMGKLGEFNLSLDLCNPRDLPCFLSVRDNIDAVVKVGTGFAEQTAKAWEQQAGDLKRGAKIRQELAEELKRLLGLADRARNMIKAFTGRK